MGEITKSEMRQKLGNVKQLQELLFGEQTREYDQKLESYRDSLNHLESNYQQLQLTIDERLEQLENKLIDQISLVENSLEKKLQYINLAHKESKQQISGDLDLLTQQTHDNIDRLQDSIKNKSSNLQAEITQSKAALDEEMRLLKQQIAEKLDSRLAELSAGKISRSDLAEVLFEVCLKLKDPDANFKLPAAEKVSPYEQDTLSEENHQ